jgi:hypothetical protein
MPSNFFEFAGLAQLFQSGWAFILYQVHSASPDAWLQSFFTLAGILIAGLTFFLQQGVANNLQRKEVYQRLELASNDLFGFEAEHAEALERFRDMDRMDWKFTPVELAALDDWVAFVEGEHGREIEARSPGALRQLEADWRKTRKYFEKALNLFEMATRLRKARVLEADVFGSWTIWFYETLCEWGFRKHWDNIKQNYTGELRGIFDYFVLHFDPASDDSTRKRAFFGHVARLFKCEVIASWLDGIERQDDQLAAGRLPVYPFWWRTPFVAGASKKPQARNQVAPGVSGHADAGQGSFLGAGSRGQKTGLDVPGSRHQG